MNANFCRTILTKAVILFILTFTAKSSTAQWEMLIPNPTGESVTDIYMRDDSTGFLINTNGLYRTGSGPNSWELIWNIDLVNECTDLDFGNGIGVIVGKNGFSLISRDNGESWGNLNTSFLTR
ncbi:MAG: hypothetical protein AAFY45_33840 [Bacteroidota bacterium]